MLTRFRQVALAEGVSYLLLLGVAMPLKYLADWPLGVRIVGGLHGVLFILYVFLCAGLLVSGRWSFGRAVWAGFLSLIPLGTFWLEHQLRQEERASASPPASV